MLYAVKVKTKHMIVDGKMTDVAHMNWTDTVYVTAGSAQEAERQAVDHCAESSNEYVEVLQVEAKGD